MTNRKNQIILSGFLSFLLLIGNVSAEGLSSSGVVVDEKIYASLAPRYTADLIKSYGPVPVFGQDNRVVSRGIMAGIPGITGRDALYKKLHDLYEATKEPVDNQYSWPRGPVISYGYDALGSVVVGVYEKETMDEMTMNELHSFIAAEAEKQGIRNVPVLFCREPMPQLDRGRIPVRSLSINGAPVGGSPGSFSFLKKSYQMTGRSVTFRYNASPGWTSGNAS